MFKNRWPTLILLVLFFVPMGWFSVAQISRPANAGAATTYEQIELFTDVLSIVQRSYVEEVDLKELIYGGINGMLSALDPHSSFLPPDMYREMKIDTSGEFGGLGVEITIRDGILTVVSPIEDTPAFRAGLQAGDQILKIEDRFTKDLGIMEAVNLMRGPAGSKITITVLRESFDKPREFTITREVIQIKSVKARTLEGGYGYVRLSQFQERTFDDLKDVLKQLREENAGMMKGLVLDLRNNPGGLLDQAVKVADTFLDQGLIVYTKGREEGSEMEFSARPDNTEPRYPMVVLINGGSASASEIVAGALRDHARAVIMGTRSFGKGSVQTIIPLSDNSGLRLTTARYFTPSGTSIQARGIEPDIEVKPVEVKEIDDQSHLREKDLENHIESPASSPPPENSTKNHFELKQGDSGDFQLMRALDLLKGWHIFKDMERPAA